MTKQEQADKLFGKNEVVKRIWINLPETLDEACTILNNEKGYQNYKDRFNRADSNIKKGWLLEYQNKKYSAWLIKKFKI